MRDDKEVCEICGKPLAGQTWTDDDEFGDVHEKCAEEKREERGYE